MYVHVSVYVYITNPLTRVMGFHRGWRLTRPSTKSSPTARTPCWRGRSPSWRPSLAMVTSGLPMAPTAPSAADTEGGHVGVGLQPLAGL